jgi:rhodanese-related sulfurtransferase
MSLQQLQSGSVEEVWQWILEATPNTDDCFHVYVVCRRGNDSQMAAQLLQRYDKELSTEVTGQKGHGGVCIRDLMGGLVEWTNTVDPHFPKY